MPHCIYCEKEVPHRIAPAPSDKSICIDCIISLRKFEMAHMDEIVNGALPQRVTDAMRRLRSIDPRRATEPEVQEQMRLDLQTVQQVISF
jgi:hypothetical protein